ncbi:hypothetical protein V502_09318 [Pseudogymnoascus sp. VKM F-4520 (FW-2644)]|nr:hypothetical protein V502_09318 [Pseudogymnoascus sp. VKM F-4520 (FW-2644)]
MIDDEYFAVDVDEVDRQRPPGVPCKSAYFASIVKLSDITAEILRLYYTTTPGTAVGLKPEKDYNSLLQLDAQLESWKEELPSFLRFDINNQSSDPTNLFVRQAHLLHHRLLYSRILLFQRVVVRMAAESFAQPQKSTSTRLEQTLGLGCVETCTWLLPPPWYTVFAIYTAGTVLAVVFITPAFRNELDVNQLTALRHSWELSIDSLKQYQQLNVPSASKCLWNLLKIYKVLESETRSSELNAHDVAPVGTGTDIGSATAPNLCLSEDGQCIFPGQDDPRQLEALFLDSTFWADENMDWLVEVSNANEMDNEMEQNIEYRGSRRYGQGHIPIDLPMAELDDLPGREPTSNKSCKTQRLSREDKALQVEDHAGNMSLV